MGFEEDVERSFEGLGGGAVVEERVVAGVVVRVQMEHGRLGGGGRPEAGGAALAAELGGLGDDLVLPAGQPAGAMRLGVDHHGPAEGDDFRHLLLQVHGRLHGPGRAGDLVVAGEAPDHEIPGHAPAVQHAGFEGGAGGAPVGGVVAAEVVHRHRYRLRLADGVHPVAADQALRAGGMHRVRVFGHVFAEEVALEGEPFRPVRLARLGGDFGDAGAGGELGAAGVAPAGGRAPVLAIDPEAVHAVGLDQFQHLRDHQFVGVAAQPAGRAGAALALGIDRAPFGAEFEGAVVDHARVVHAQADAQLGGHLAMDLQGVRDDAGSGGADLGGPGGVAGMALAVALDPVRADGAPAFAEVLVGDFAAEFGVVRVGMEVVVDAEEDVFVPVAPG